MAPGLEGKGKKQLDENLISILRGIRTSLQVVAEPIDWAARFLNNKRGYPPLWLRQKVGDLNDFEGSGGEYIAYLKLLCGLKPGDELLDIGCGCGLMCLPLSENLVLPKYLKSYVGMDTDKGLIDWCRENVKYGNCFFILLEDRDGGYLPAESNSFDVILAKSLFTHLLKEETENYLNEIKRLLRLGGRCLATFFLLNEVEPKGRYTFKFVSYPEAYERITGKRAAVAYDEKWLLGLLKRMGFSVDVYSGSWRGDGKGLSFQDIIILRR